MFSLPPVETLSSVGAALAWLLELGPSTPADQILQAAHTRGLIDAVKGSHWKASGPVMCTLVRSALRRAPPAITGAVLHGIGELNARSHSRVGGPIRAFLRAHRRTLDFTQLLDVAAALDDQFRRPPTLDVLSASQWLTGARLQWSDFQVATGRLQHPWLDSSGIFGFFFVARAVLRVDPGAVGRWVIAHPHRPALASIAGLLSRLAMRAGALTSLLGSEVPSFRLVAAAALVSPVFPPATPTKVRDILTTLVRHGFDQGDAVWIAGLLIKEAVHSRYQLEDGQEKSTARLKYLERKPKEAFGGMHDAEQRHLQQRIADMNKCYATLLPKLEEMLSELAAGWPSGGLADGQLAQLENIFVDTAEIRLRLAEKVVHGGNRRWLLDRNLVQLKSYLGLTRPRETIDQPLYLTDSFATRIGPWTARSIILLYQDDERGAGRFTSNLLLPLTAEAEKLLTQPFYASRSPMAWQYATTRAACAYLFAFMVVAAMPEARRPEMKRLNQLATEHALALLSLHLPPQNQDRVLDRLAASAVQQMNFYDIGFEMRRVWALHQKLGVFPRAIALWSAPDLVDEFPQLAIDLFLAAGTLPLSCNGQNYQFSNLITLLDSAIAAGAQANRGDLLTEIEGLWARLYADWLPITDEWANAASDFISAVETNGPQRAKFCDNPAFANTFCRALIEVRRTSALAVAGTVTKTEVPFA